MASQSAAFARAAPDQSPLGWLVAIPLGCLVLMQALLALTGIVPILDGALADSDAYMRLARVLQLHDSGAWFDPREPRVNPPEGHVQHWTRPLDALLLAGAWLLQPFLGFERALHLWGVLISPALLALALVAVGWAAAPALDRDARVLACLALLTQPIVLAYTSLGRPDHHSLLLLMAVILIGLTARLAAAPQDRRAAHFAGAIAALSIWVSPEAMTFVAVSLATLGLFWLSGTQGLAGSHRAYLMTTAAVLALGLVLERGPDGLLAVESDRLSIVHVVLFALIAAFWIAVGRGGGTSGLRAGSTATARQYPDAAASGSTPTFPTTFAPLVIRRLLVALIGLGGIAAVMLLCFPDLRYGPLGTVDPLYARIRLHNIVEIQPLVPADWLSSGRLGEALSRLIKVVGIALFAVPFLAVLLIRSTGRAWRFWATIALALLAFLPLAFYQVRWAGYAEAFLVWPYAAGIAWALRRLTSTAGRASGLLRPLVVLAALLWPLLLAQALPRQEIETAQRACPLDRLAPVLNRAAPAPRTLLAFTDYGSELLYRTPHRVLSIPNHRPQPGFAATYRILTATDEPTARAELTRFEVDWILLCPSATERALFAVPGVARPTLYQRLVAGDAPPWLRPLPLEGDLAADARLFEVVRQSGRSAAASSGAPR
ncbi:MAG TPA: hypothetical protein VFZ10_08930 [Geminicoccaceae bacterium]